MKKINLLGGEAFLSAALEGLQAQADRVALQIQAVNEQLGQKRPGKGETTKPKAKRDMSDAGRAKIIAGQRKRWDAFRKAKKAKKG
jgi:hypothetical protein